MSTSASDERCSLLRRRRQVMGPAYRLFYEEPLHVVSAEGVWLTDADGNRYLDMYNNVPHVGHCHPRVVDAIASQLRTLNTHTRYLHENVVGYAERLLGHLPNELDVAMFSCSGSEANELALRIARAATGGTGIIVIEEAYHGTTQATFEVSTEDNPRDEWPIHIEVVSAPDAFRGPFRDHDAGRNYALQVEGAIERMTSRGIRPAAFLIDTIASSSGVVSPPAGYLKAVAGIVRKAGALFIADEVQPGFGRTGDHFWGFEADDFVPDIVTMGKPMGNGYPLAATVVRRSLADQFAERYGYFNTFGGNPVSAAAGLAVLDVIEEEQLQANARSVGRYLTEGIQRIATSNDLIGDVRSRGLFIGVELVEDSQSRTPATTRAAAIVNGLKAGGVLTNTIGPHGSVLKLRPPIVFSVSDADFFLERFEQVLGTV